MSRTTPPFPLSSTHQGKIQPEVSHNTHSAASFISMPLHVPHQKPDLRRAHHICICQKSMISAIDAAQLITAANVPGL